MSWSVVHLKSVSPTKRQMKEKSECCLGNEIGEMCGDHLKRSFNMTFNVLFAAFLLSVCMSITLC